jgi:hypothetical protein
MPLRLRPSIVLRAVGFTLIAVVAGCWIVAGTEDFEAETTTSGTATGGSGTGTGNSAGNPMTTASTGGGGASSQGGGGMGQGGGGGCAGGCPSHAPDCIDGTCACAGTQNQKACGLNEQCTPSGCICPGANDPAPDPMGPMCKDAYPVCGPNGCECTLGSCVGGFVCSANQCKCDNDSDCGSVMNTSCDEPSGLCNCLNGVCLAFGQWCGTIGTCDCLNCAP